MTRFHQVLTILPAPSTGGAMTRNTSVMSMEKEWTIPRATCSYSVRQCPALSNGYQAIADRAHRSPVGPSASPPETRKTLAFETMFDKEGMPQGESGIARNLHSCTRRQNAGGTSTHQKYTEEQRTREAMISYAISSYSCFLVTRGHFAAYLHHLFKTLLDCQEEAPKHLDEPAAQLSQHNTSTRSTL